MICVSSIEQNILSVDSQENVNGFSSTSEPDTDIEVDSSSLKEISATASKIGASLILFTVISIFDILDSEFSGPASSALNVHKYFCQIRFVDLD